MKSKRLTNVLLAVIAVNLTVLTLSQVNVFPEAKADAQPMSANETAFPPSQYGIVPVNADGSITVKLVPGDEIDVNITGIDTYDEMDVNIDEVGGGSVSYGGPLEVEIDD